MEKEAAINFHSLRAKFQESQSKERRPPVPERPKRLPATVTRCGPQFPLNKPTITPMEDKMPICSKNIVRDDHKKSISLPISLQTTTAPATVSISNPISKVPFKDRHLPLVLPIPFSSEPKHHSVSPPKAVSSPVRGKKKTMIMPFKSTITSKFGKGTLENGVNHSSMEKSKVENGFSHNGDSSNPGSVNPSPEKPGTPPPVDAIEGSSTEGSASQTSHQRVLSTLERAKRKFSPKQLLEYAKPRSFHSRNSSPSASPPPPPADYENMITERYSPVPQPEGFLPPVPFHACPSPFKSNGISLNYATVNRDRGFVLDRPAMAPPVNSLPDLHLLGHRPVKPPRPPLVDLKPFSTTNEIEQHALNTVSASAASEDLNLDQHVPEVPDFPNFDPSEPVHSAHSAFDANASTLATLTSREVDLPPPDPVEFGCVDFSDRPTDEQAALEAPTPPALPPWVDTQPSLEEGTDELLDYALRNTQTTDSFVTSELPSDQKVGKEDDFYDHGDNIYEDVASVAKFHFNQNSRKRKGAPKNPYGSPNLNELTRKTGRSIAPWSKETGERVTLTHRNSVRKERGSPETHELKEQKKKEKQNQEKEKKEQKERQKRENEMKKKFKVTGLEEPMYHAKVMVASKVRKHDLPVKCGDTVSIIRTTNCPKGKWLARDVTHRYGYVSLKNLELNIKEMLELGKRASQTAGLANEGDTISLGSRSSTQNPTHTSSFTDDSEEWTFEEETLSPTTDMSQCRSMSMPDMFGSDGNFLQTQADATENDVTAQTRHDALQKLAIFFEQSKGSFDDPTENGEATPTNAENRDLFSGIEDLPYIEQVEDFDFAGVELLPPPELYADT